MIYFCTGNSWESAETRKKEGTKKFVFVISSKVNPELSIGRAIIASNKNRFSRLTHVNDELMFQGLDNVSSATLRPFNSDINTPRIDSYRFSMANLEGELSFSLSLVHNDGRVYRAISVSSLRKKRKKSKVLSPLFVHPRESCSPVYIRFVSPPVCRTVFPTFHPLPFCASWINEHGHRGQKGRFIPRDCVFSRRNEGNEDARFASILPSTVLTTSH